MKSTKHFLLLLILCPLFSFSQSEQAALNQEEKAIIAVIEGETKAHFERDYETWSNSFVHADYYREHRFWEGWKDKVRTTSGWETKLAKNKKRFNGDLPKNEWNDAKYVRSNINIQVSEAKDMAWVTYHQRAMNLETKEVIGKSLETRIMEKHDGQWKIAFMSYHYFPKELNN